MRKQNHQERVIISYDQASPLQEKRVQELTSCLAPLTRDVKKLPYHDRGALLPLPQPNAYHWLILVHSQEVENTPASYLVDHALDLVVKRQMKGVLLITTESDASLLPPKWASIRAYDESHLRDIPAVMAYAKTPYEPSTINPSRRALPFIAAILLVLLVIVFPASFYFFGVPAIQIPHLVNRPQAAQTAAAKQTAIARQTAIAKSATVIKGTTSPLLPYATMSSTALYTYVTTELKPDITGFKQNQWPDRPPACQLGSKNSYQVTATTPGNYQPCPGPRDSTDFAYQVKIHINGDAAGIIFGPIEDGFYRFAVTPTDKKYSVIACQATGCQATVVSSGEVLDAGSLPSTINSTEDLILTVIAQEQEKRMDLYVNGQSLVELPAKRNSPLPIALNGRIELYAAPIQQMTTATFSDLKVWNLDKQSQSTPSKGGTKGRPTPTPTDGKVMDPGQ